MKRWVLQNGLRGEIVRSKKGGKDSMSKLLERITVNPNVCHGQPCVRGTRIMVWLILQYLANDDSEEDILAAYPALETDDIHACLAYAAESARERILPIEIHA